MAVVQDLNGDGVMKFEDDLYGIYMQGVPYRGFQTALDVQFIITGEDGKRRVSPLTDRIMDACGKANRLRDTEGLLTDGQAALTARNPPQTSPTELLTAASPSMPRPVRSRDFRRPAMTLPR